MCQRRRTGLVFPAPLPRRSSYYPMRRESDWHMRTYPWVRNCFWIAPIIFSFLPLQGSRSLMIYHVAALPYWSRRLPPIYNPFGVRVKDLATIHHDYRRCLEYRCSTGRDLRQRCCLVKFSGRDLESHPGVWQEEWVPLWGGCSILLFRFLRAIYVITYFYVDFGDWSVALADVGAWPLCELLLLLRLQRAGWCRRFHFESLPDLPLREAISIKRRQFSLLLSCC